MNNASDADACIAVSFKEFDTAILKCVNIFDPIMETCALPSKTSNDAGCTRIARSFSNLQIPFRYDLFWSEQSKLMITLSCSH